MSNYICVRPVAKLHIGAMACIIVDSSISVAIHCIVNIGLELLLLSTYSLTFANGEVTLAGYVHKYRDDNVVCMWVQLKG